MHFGLTIFPTDYTAQPDEFARRAEERGFESIWFPEHTHIPVERRSPWPGGPNLPREYYNSYDPFIALTAAAMVTRDLKLATGICLIVQRDPIPRPRLSPRWTASPTADSSSASAAPGTPRRSRITASPSRSASPSCENASSP